MLIMNYKNIQSYLTTQTFTVSIKLMVVSHYRFFLYVSIFM